MIALTCNLAVLLHKVRLVSELPCVAEHLRERSSGERQQVEELSSEREWRGIEFVDGGTRGSGLTPQVESALPAALAQVRKELCESLSGLGH